MIKHRTSIFRALMFSVSAILIAVNAQASPGEDSGLHFVKQVPNFEKINILSGVPLVSKQDTSGGFGDVASNVAAAIELKTRFPNMKITLLVTSQNEELLTSSSRSATEIVQILLPETDAKKLAERQTTVAGFDVIYLPPLPELAFQKVEGSVLGSIYHIIPPADLTLQFSANHSPVKALLHAKNFIGLSFNELEGETSVFKNGTLNAGPLSNGIYFLKSLKGPEQQQRQRRIINDWLSQNEIPELNFESEEFTLGYMSSAKLAQAQLQAMVRIALENPDKHFTLFQNIEIKKSFTIPANLRLIYVKALPLKVHQALFALASLTPICRGDLSFSTLLSTTNASKAFIYDTEIWKREFAKATKLLLLKSGKLSSEQVNSLFIDSAGDEVSANQIYRLMMDRSLSKEVDLILKKELPSLDLFSNSFHLARQLYRFKREFMMLRMAAAPLAARLLNQYGMIASDQLLLQQALHDFRKANDFESFLVAFVILMKSDFEMTDQDLSRAKKMIAIRDRAFEGVFADLLAINQQRASSRRVIESTLSGHDQNDMQFKFRVLHEVTAPEHGLSADETQHYKNLVQQGSEARSENKIVFGGTHSESATSANGNLSCEVALGKLAF